MNRQQEFEKLSNVIRDAEAQLKVFKNNLGIIDREIDQLSILEAQLEENLAFLKKKNIIALAQEYKKAKDDLAKAKNRLAMIRIDRQNVDRANSDIEKFLQNHKDLLAKYLSSPNNVIYGLFGRKNGQE